MIEQHFKFSRAMNFSLVAASFSASLSEVCGVIIEAIKRGQNKKKLTTVPLEKPRLWPQGPPQIHLFPRERTSLDARHR